MAQTQPARSALHSSFFCLGLPHAPPNPRCSILGEPWLVRGLLPRASRSEGSESALGTADDCIRDALAPGLSGSAFHPELGDLAGLRRRRKKCSGPKTFVRGGERRVPLPALLWPRNPLFQMKSFAELPCTEQEKSELLDQRHCLGTPEPWEPCLQTTVLPTEL